MTNVAKRGSISEALMTLIHEAHAKNDSNIPNISRLTAQDSFIPLGAAAYHVLPSANGIVEAATTLLQKNQSNKNNPIGVKHHKVT